MKDILIGQQLANFRVERLLGQGGMATIYYGQDVKLQRPVAIKVIDKRYKNDPAHAQRFVNEARMMAKWRHENIIQIYYADDAQGFSYYVMEYVDGQDLSTVMSLYAQDDELMPIADVLRVGNAAANALDYAHREGVVHRDVKPSNILISKDGRVLLGDFGMALEVRDGSMGSIFGTPHYISPEQARRSADAVPQSDLYSLGVILYEVLTGTLPFDDPSPASLALQHITEAPPSPRSVNPELTPAVESVLLKALEKNPRNRFQSGAKLMAALENAVAPAGASVKLPLPPLPVGVPTIKRSNIPIQQIARRAVPGKVSAAKELRTPSMEAEKKISWVYAVFFLLLLLATGSWFFAKNISSSIAEAATQTFTSPFPILTDVPAQPTQTLTVPLAVPTSDVFPPIEQPVGSSTEVVAVPTIKYPDGNNFSMFWNDTSFILLNRSRTRRSYSGFIFERLDNNANPTDRFYGYDWFDIEYKYLPSRTCLGIYVSQNQNNDRPYIQSSECINGYVAIAKPQFDRDKAKIFWSAKEGSTQFRVLWLNEEVARCEISTGTCEVYIP